MTSTPPPGTGTPDQDPPAAPASPYAPDGHLRQPPLVPYQPPGWVDDAPVAPDPYLPAGGATSPPAYGPYGAPVQQGTGAHGPWPYPPGYGQQTGWPPQPSWDASFAPPPRQNGLALASMITSLAGMLFCLLPGIVGLILGIVALQQISRDGTTGRGYAITGVVVGAVTTALLVLWWTAAWTTR